MELMVEVIVKLKFDPALICGAMKAHCFWPRGPGLKSGCCSKKLFIFKYTAVFQILLFRNVNLLSAVPWFILQILNIFILIRPALVVVVVTALTTG